MSERKEFKPVKFTIADGEHKGNYAIVAPKANIPAVGVVTAEELAKDSKMLAHLVSVGSGIIEKVEKVSKEPKVEE